LYALINSDADLSNQHKLLCSIDGVGTKVATKMIAKTNGFRDFSDGRSFCCYAGVAPFEYSSGSSIHSKNRVSHRADKSIKSLLNMSAISCSDSKKRR
jgi:transposase